MPDNQQPTDPSKRKGCVVLSALALMMLLPILGGLGLVYWLSRSEPAQQSKRVLREGVEHYQQIRNAPGAKLLRRSGCDTAYVVDMTLLQRVFSRRDGGAGDGSLPPGSPELVVLCKAEVVAAAPSCEEAARLYLTAGPRPKRLFAMLIEDAAGRQLCAKRFDATGKALGPYLGSKVGLRPPPASSP